MAEDISKKTIFVLVILTIVVSALGTLTVMDSVNRSNFDDVPTVQDGTNSASGMVNLKIGEGPGTATTGRVILELVRTN